MILDFHASVSKAQSGSDVLNALVPKASVELNIYDDTVRAKHDADTNHSVTRAEQAYQRSGTINAYVMNASKP